MDFPAFGEIFHRINIIFWLSGIPLDDPNLNYRFYFACLCLIITLYGEFTFFFQRISAENIMELLDLTPCVCLGFLSLLKGIFLAWKHKKIIKLKICLKDLYEAISESKEKKNLICKNVVKVNAFVKYYFILNSALIVFYNFSPLFFMLYSYLSFGEVKFLIPYAVIFPFSYDDWPGWTVVYIQSVLSGFYCVMFITMTDALFCVLTSQICNHFYIISDEIKNLKVNDPVNLSKIVQKHQYILKLSEDLEDIYELTNLFAYLVGSLEICALGFSITIGSWGHILGYVLFLLSVLLQILMMSVFGENIIQESRRVEEAAFLSKWHEMDVKAKRTILIIMIRSQKQQQLTAYKFSVISYGSFTKIISTSWSYFTILKTAYKPPETSAVGN